MTKKTYIQASILISVALVLVGSFVFTKGEISYAELAYTEFSHVLGKSAGGLIPASCESNPPTSHWTGDCPVVVETGISASARSVSASLSPASQTVWDTGTITWTSSGTKCRGSWTGDWLPSSGSKTFINYSYGTINATIICTDGVFWSPQRSAAINFTYYDTGGGGG